MDGLVTIEKDIEGLLDRQRGMSLVPSWDKGFLLAGDYCFQAKPEGGELVSDQFAVRILVPDTFPSQLPTVWEAGSRIPKKADWHVNIKTDCSICLGGRVKSSARRSGISRFDELLGEYASTLPLCRMPSRAPWWTLYLFRAFAWRGRAY